MNTTILEEVAKKLVAPGKGILAADESSGTIEKRFKALGIENTEENRMAYRKMLFSTLGAEKYISGVIMFDETIHQDILKNPAIIPGIKVDQGLEPFNGSDIEKVSKKFDALPSKLQEYAKLGAKFTKWRAVFTITDNLPTANCILENAKLLASYASMCQEYNIVPIVEPEVLLDGNHTIERCQEVMEKVITEVFSQLKAKNAYLPGLILKSSMALSGKDCPTQATSNEIAKRTLQIFGECVPAEVAGIVFLSGGQSDIEATKNLNEIVKMANEDGGAPWPITFSYGRGLQDGPMKIWAGKSENIEKAQKEFLSRAKANSLACQGKL